MDFPQLGTPIGIILITCWLWVWTLRRSKAHLFQQQLILKDQNNAANLAFAICIVLELTAAATEGYRWVFGAFSFASFYLFALLSNRSEESFWRKKRNSIVAGSFGLLFFSSMPYLFSDLIVTPLLACLAITHLAHMRFIGIFSDNLRDLKALQVKLLRYDADLKNISNPMADSHSHVNSYAERMETTA